MTRPQLLQFPRHVLLGGGRRGFAASSALQIINKICPSAREAIANVSNGATLLVGGFGLSGVPSTLINALRDRPDIRDFTVVSNNAGMPGVGLGEMI
jgi:3-oxoacid CoA-transferase